MSETVYTIGHSTHAEEQFLALLKQHGITAVADVRSSPYSPRNPQFNREYLQRALAEGGIDYVFLGAELGARSDDPACYVNSQVQFDRLAATESFQRGLARVRERMRDNRLALMCAEKDPLECHRTILVARQLAARGVAVIHILADGTTEGHEQALARLVRQLKMPECDLFRSRDDVLDDAYRMQGARIAYTDEREALDFGL